MKNEIEHKKRLLELERDASKLNDELKRLRIHEELAEKYDEDDDIFEDFEERFNKLKASTPEKAHVAPVVKDDDRWREVFGSQFANSRSHPNSSSFVAPSNSVLHSLPRGLKRFNGDPKEFPLFMANFKFLVHDVINDDGVRLARLREALEPHVASRIANLLFNSSNYFSAMKALKNKYGHPFLISKGHIDALRKLPVVKEDDSKMLREFVEKLNSAVAALMTSDYSSELYSTTLLTEILRKLPSRLRNEWGQVVIDLQPRPPNLRDFDVWLERASMRDMYANPMAITFS